MRNKETDPRAGLYNDAKPRLLLFVTPDFPIIVCLCGSTKYKKQWEETNLEETLSGKIVLSVGGFMHADSIPITEEQKTKLDELHKRKIDLADEILVINVDGYIGSSTRSEIEYAASVGKPIRYRYSQ